MHDHKKDLRKSRISLIDRFTCSSRPMLHRDLDTLDVDVPALLENKEPSDGAACEFFRSVGQGRGRVQIMGPCIQGPWIRVKRSIACQV